MKKLVFVALAIIATVAFCMKSNPIDTCPDPVQQISLKFAKHADAKITDAHFVKSETTLSGKITRHYYDVTFKLDNAMRTRRASLPIDNGKVCDAYFIN